VSARPFGRTLPPELRGVQPASPPGVLARKRPVAVRDPVGQSGSGSAQEDPPGHTGGAEARWLEIRRAQLRPRHFVGRGPGRLE